MFLKTPSKYFSHGVSNEQLRMKEQPKFWELIYGLFYQCSIFYLCLPKLGEKKLSVTFRETFWLWGSATFFVPPGTKLEPQPKSPSEELFGVTRKLVRLTFELSS